MRIILIFLLCSFSLGVCFAEKSAFVDKVQFIQYLEESTALEEVKKGNLDIYYSRIPTELLQGQESTRNLQIFSTTGGSYSILVNPATGENFNPFSYQQVRFSLNYLVDRKLIVDELMGGNGLMMTSNYGPFDPDYFLIVNELEKFHFRYDPELANSMITNTLIEHGAKKIDGRWTYDDKPIEITFFIRNDDPIRNSIGEVISAELEKIGFVVKKDYGDLNKAFVVVYGSDPADLKWSMYTEGYAGRSAFVKYDPLGLAQMYAPWFSNMPGFNNPAYWNYKNSTIDDLTQRIYSSNFTSSEQRADLIRNATKNGVQESVRIFLASKIDPFVANKSVDGIINDFGAGITTRFTPINARTDDSELKIGVKQIYQGAWNPVAGLGDAYSKNIWDALYDPGIFKNPYSGENFGVREKWKVETAGPIGTLDVPDDAINWSTSLQKWVPVGQDAKATSKITIDLLWSNWHDGKKMDMNDVLYSIYFTQEWGSPPQENDKTFDPDFSPSASQSAQTLVGIRILDDHRLEVYVNYWHFDESEIAGWAGVWPTMPWEVMYGMEQAVLDGKTSFSRTDAQAKNLDWLSLITPRDSSLIRQLLETYSANKKHPLALDGFDNSDQYYQERYFAAIEWIKDKKHAVISNGPFYLEGYSPEARTITIKAFDDPTYPFEAGFWKKFEQVQFPKIIEVSVPEKLVKNQTAKIPIRTTNASHLYYFVTDAAGNQEDYGILSVKSDDATIILPKDLMGKMALGGNDLKVYAISDSVLRPDIYATSFLVVDSDEGEVSTSVLSEGGNNTQTTFDFGFASIIAGSMIILFIFYVRQKRKKATLNPSQ